MDVKNTVLISGQQSRDFVALWRKQIFRSIAATPDEPIYLVKFYDSTSLLMTATVNFTSPTIHLYRAGGNYKDPWETDGEQPSAYSFDASNSASLEFRAALDHLFHTKSE